MIDLDYYLYSDPETGAFYFYVSQNPRTYSAYLAGSADFGADSAVIYSAHGSVVADLTAADQVDFDHASLHLSVLGAVALLELTELVALVDLAEPTVPIALVDLAEPAVPIELAEQEELLELVVTE